MPRNTGTIYKSFARPNLDCSNIVYNQLIKIEAVQKNAALAIKNTIKGNSGEKLYKELGIESLSFRQ